MERPFFTGESVVVNSPRQRYKPTEELFPRLDGFLCILGIDFTNDLAHSERGCGFSHGIFSLVMMT